MDAGDKALHSFCLNAEMVGRVWDGALWDVSDEICIMMRGKLAY